MKLGLSGFPMHDCLHTRRFKSSEHWRHLVHCYKQYHIKELLWNFQFNSIINSVPFSIFISSWPKISAAFSQTRTWLQLLERQSSKDCLDSSATTLNTCPCMRRTSLNSDIQKFPIKYSDYVAETWRELFQFSTATVMRGLRRANITTWPLWTGHQSKGKLRFYYRWR